jgi:hypothetical protein
LRRRRSGTGRASMGGRLRYNVDAE